MREFNNSISPSHIHYFLCIFLKKIKTTFLKINFAFKKMNFNKIFYYNKKIMSYENLTEKEIDKLLEENRNKNVSCSFCDIC